jgi:hypothetical protein
MKNVVFKTLAKGSLAVLIAVGSIGMVGMVGCGANIPAPEEIDANPQADKEAMKKSIEEMQRRYQESAGNRATSKVDVDKQVEQSAGGGN